MCSLALPYQPNGSGSVDLAAGRFWITMANSGSASVHHSIHCNAFRSDGPWHYDIAMPPDARANERGSTAAVA